MKINRNMSAVRANKQLLGTENRLSKSMKRLSSGYKINSAEDNPAGMAISNKMKAQIEALDQAKSNSSDAQNVMKIADGALGEVSSMLQRIRELAVQGASDTYSENDKKALQSEIDELTKEVDRISGDTEYNTKSLLDGSSDTRVYVRQKDANGNMTQVNSYITRINFSDNVASDKYELTVNSLATQATGSLASATKPDAEGTISINGVSVAVKADMTQDEYIQALQKAATTAGTTMQVNGDSISFLSNEYGSDSTVNISLSSSLKALAGAGYENADDGSGNMQLKSNGKDAVVTGGENLSDKTIRADGNRVYVVGNSGFSMDFLLSSDMDMTAGSSNLQIDISDIGNMAVQIGANEGQEMKIRIPEVSSQTLYLDTVDVTVKGGADKAMSTLDEAIEYVSGVRSRIGAFQNGVSVAVKADMTQDEYIQALQKAATTAGTTMQVNGDSISFLSNEYGSDSTVNISLSSSLKALAGAGYENADDGSGNMQLKSNGKDAVVTGGENLSDKTIRADGNRVYVVGNSGFSMDFLLSSDMDMTAGSSNLQIDISDIGNMAVQIGANEGQEMKIRIPEVSSQTLYLDTVDVTVKGGADKAMSTLDEAIEYVSGVRSRIGAFQNRLESAESSLSETSENMTGAYSNIMDTDMATEMTEYAAQNILDQAGISVLSQANDLPQQVLSLLSR